LKKLILPLVTIVLIAGVFFIVFNSLANKERLIVVKEGNSEKKPLKITLGKFQDGDCGMAIEDISYASQVIFPSGKTLFFHDHGGFVNKYKKDILDKDLTIWVMAKDTKKWIDGRQAWYSLNDKTPMNYGFGAYEKKQNNFVNFETFVYRMLRNQTLNNPITKKQLLEMNNNE
jgi:hypothetical protein